MRSSCRGSLPLMPFTIVAEPNDNKPASPAIMINMFPPQKTEFALYMILLSGVKPAIYKRALHGNQTQRWADVIPVYCNGRCMLENLALSALTETS
jgi:hypothetical protein